MGPGDVERDNRPDEPACGPHGDSFMWDGGTDAECVACLRQKLDSVQDGYDTAVKDGNRLADALVKSREEVERLKAIVTLEHDGHADAVALLQQERDKHRVTLLQVRALTEAIDYALDVFEVVYRTGRTAQGGEQNGNWECIEMGYRRLQRVIANKGDRKAACSNCGHDDVNLGWCADVQRPEFEMLHCRACCEFKEHWGAAGDSRVSQNRVGVKIDLRDITDEERAALPPFKISDSSVLFVDSGSGDIGPPGPVAPTHKLKIVDKREGTFICAKCKKPMQFADGMCMTCFGGDPGL